MNISKIEIRACKTKGSVLNETELRHGTVRELNFLVLSMFTDDGLRADTFGFGSASAEAVGKVAADLVRPHFMGQDPLYRERLWQEWRMADRHWLHVPIYSYGPFDIACWLLAAQSANQPLYRYLGAYRDRVPIYGSSMFMPEVEDYVHQAVETKEAGWAAYKLHPPGDPAFDREAYRACREAVGDDFPLMTDPVAAYSHESALKMGRELERLNYKWLEEPLYDVDFHGLKKLTDKLDIPICGTEVLAGSHYATAHCIKEGIVDMVRTDVSWKGGITPVMKTAHLAESFGMQCELHTTVFHPLDLVNLHCNAAIKNSEFFEVLLPTSYYDFGLKEPIKIEDGHAVLPDGPGLGIELDWDLIDDCTVAVY
ncbi:MAG: enolase C-terminal domain-like protein [Planctomycetota bacterium]